MAVKTYSAGVKAYRETYRDPNYTPRDTDLRLRRLQTDARGRDGDLSGKGGPIRGLESRTAVAGTTGPAR
jgi:hypothetical protein